MVAQALKSSTRMERPLLRDHEVHVAWLWIDAHREDLPALRATLSADERRRADRLRFSRDRAAFAITRATLRALLGRYLDVEPAQVRLRYGPFGKPALAQETRAGRLEFNVSRSDGLAIFAITRGRSVGVDLERIRPLFPHREVAERVLTARERAALNALPPAQRTEAFFHCWTRKEAYVKAKGTGVSLPLDRFSVSLTPGDRARLLEVLENPDDTSQWSLEALTPEPGYVAAIAAEGSDWKPTCRPLNLRRRG